jgi:MinD-like ATPase involved in chromosome partitioning or flagellar assembly
MLRLAVITPNPLAADAIEMLAQESGAFEVCYKASPVPPVKEVLRVLSVQNPAVILIDLGDWDEASRVTNEIQHSKTRAVLIGFRPRWNRAEQLTFEDAGILDLLHEPFSPGDIEGATYDAMHRRYPITHQNILAFLPAKAGSGCSTVTVHLAAALSEDLKKKVLLIEADRRSGPLAVMLNLERQKGIPDALEHHGAMSPLEWRQVTAQLQDLDLLLANPNRRGRLPTWADYYQLLLFAQKHYDYIVVDLPEVINQATAEFVRHARAVFIVSQPELPSLKLAKLRRAELESCEVPRERVNMLVNRWEKGRFSKDVEKLLGTPVFGTLPNDYKEVRKAMAEMRLAAPSSAFAKACDALVQEISGLPVTPIARPKFTLLRKLGTVSS